VVVDEERKEIMASKGRRAVVGSIGKSNRAQGVAAMKRAKKKRNNIRKKGKK
jgi:hypothetical protein